MNRSSFTYNSSHYGITKLFSGRRLLLQIILPTLFCSLFLMASAQANESPINIVDTWVEDGYLFHVAFEAQPANANCELEGEGLIEFEVAYESQTSSGVQSVFGVATWYPNFDTEDWIETQGQAIGPQAFCTTFSPCRIQEVNIVQTWCPVKDGPLFSR